MCVMRQDQLGKFAKNRMRTVTKAGPAITGSLPEEMNEDHMDAEVEPFFYNPAAS